MGQMIEFAANGGTCAGYLALPDPDTANGRGVIVIQEWWGLVQHIKDVADRFAAEGYAALAPDLMHGEHTTSPDQAGRQMMALRADEAEKDLRGAIDALQARGGIAGKVGVVGFCMGGQLALLAATTSESQVGAAIDFYGIHPNVKPDFSRLSCPVLGFFGEKDDFVSPEKVDALALAIEEAGGQFDYTMYPDAGHAFFNDARPEAYEPDAAEDAWEQTLSFLADNLEGAERSGSAAHAGNEADDVQVVDDDDVEEEADVDDRHDREEAAGDDSDEREDVVERGVAGEDADERVSDDDEGDGPSVSRDDDEVAGDDEEVAASDDEDDEDDEDDDLDDGGDEVASGPGDPPVASSGHDHDDEDHDHDDDPPAAARTEDPGDDDVEIVEADAEEDDDEPAFGADEDESERRESNGAVRQVSPPQRPDSPAKRATPRNGSRKTAAAAKPPAAKAKPAKGKSFVRVAKPVIGKPAAKGKAAAKPAGKAAAKPAGKAAAKPAAKGAAKPAARGAAKSAAKAPARGAKAAAKTPARKPVAAARKGAAKVVAKPMKAAGRKPNGAKGGKAVKAPAARKAPPAKGRAAGGKASKRR